MPTGLATATPETRSASIAAVADDFAAHAVSPFHPVDTWKSRLPTPILIPLTQQQAAAGVEELSQLLPWRDDGLCYARGAVGSGRIEQMLTGRVTGPADALHAAVAVISTSLSRTGWAYHAATVIRRAGCDELQVIDRLLAPETGVLSLSAWAGKVGRTAADVRIQSPLDNIPAGSGPLTIPALPHHFEAMGRDLVDSISASRADDASQSLLSSS
ncbi:MAG: hypothetical protein JWN41_546 [Thermoleophilia bacterium]|nr:hypothetical protein [Thermoleophilia bacterium]